MSLAPNGQGHELRLGLVDESFLKNTGQSCLTLWHPSRVVLSYCVFVIAEQIRNVRNGNALLQ